MFASLSGFLLFTTLMIPLAAHAQASPFDTGFTALQTLFTGTVAKVASLIAIVIGGYTRTAVIDVPFASPGRAGSRIHSIDYAFPQTPTGRT